MTELEAHYNKFNEDKRLLSRHGQVEYITTMKYIHDCLASMDRPRILDIGAGTGRYSVALAEEGYDVTAVELVRYNLGILRTKKSSVKAFQGNALDLRRLEDSTFDLTLLLGPMYHLYSFQDKLKALREARRVTRPGGILLVAYLMNEYAVITYGFREGHIRECLEDGRLNQDFHCVSREKDLYDYVRLEDMDRLREAAGLTRIRTIAADGPADYLRPVLKAMDQEEFRLFLRYHLSTCERPELLGASAHTVDILRNPFHTGRTPDTSCPA